MSFIQSSKTEEKKEIWHPALGISMNSISQLFERMSYYGVRSILMLYMGNKLLFDQKKYLEHYGIFTSAIYIFVLVGAIIGDLVLSPSICMIVGAALQAFGCFILAIPSEYTLLVGLALIVLSTSFYKPNVLKQTAVLYHNRLNFMDAGYSIQYMAINLGAFLAPMVIGGVIDSPFQEIKFSIGFILAGFASILALIPIIISFKENELAYTNFLKQKKETSITGLLSIVLIFISIPFFWIVFEVLGSLNYNCFTKGNYTDSSNIVVLTLFLSGPIFAILWSFINFNSIFKVASGFFVLIGVIAICAFISPCFRGTNYMLIIPECLIAIPAFSIIGKHAPIKLTGLFFGILLLSPVISTKLTPIILEFVKNTPMNIYPFLRISLLIASLFLTLAILNNKSAKNSVK